MGYSRLRFFADDQVDFVMSTKPLAYYRFEDGTGSATIRDMLGDHTASSSNVAFRQYNSETRSFAASVDATSTITVPASLRTALDTSEFGISLWIKPDSWSGGAQTIFKAYADANNFYRIRISASSQLVIESNTGGGGMRNYTASMTDADSEYVHVYAHFSDTSASGLQLIYINGVLCAASSRPGTFTGSLTELFLAADTGGANPFIGLIDELIIWNGAAVPEALVLHLGWPYGILKGGDYGTRLLARSPYAMWHLDEAAGASAIVDASGNGCSGVPTNVTFGAPGIGDGRTAAYFDGTAFINVMSAAFDSLFDGEVGTIILSVKRDPAADWTTNTPYTWLQFGNYTPSNNFLSAAKYLENEIRGSRQASGVAVLLDRYWTQMPLTDTDWHTFGMTYDQTTAGVSQMYWDGGLENSKADTNSWASTALNSTRQLVGASGTTSAPLAHHWGWMAHFAVYNVRFSPRQIIPLLRY